MTTTAQILRRTLRSSVRTPCNLLLNLIDPPVIVLIYHRVTTLQSDPEMLAVSPENFRAQMHHLKENFPVVRLEENWSKVSGPAVCITFDDGYADNVREALPIIEEAGVPATFFVSTGGIGTTNEFWWHEVERMVLEQQDIPRNFTLEDARYGKGWPTVTIQERQDCYQDIIRLMNLTDVEHRNAWLEQLRLWAPREETSDKHRVMTVAELRLLARSELVTIGAHTVSHTRLSSLSRESQRMEISSSKKQLETWLGREISTFSYPFGRRADYTGQSIKLCRDAGFTKAAANFPGQAHRWTDPYQIPRHLVRNWPVELFADKLKGFWTR
jgi:peptidoglycan/xylan/chitin deacetylase (PgdA/CDA1 family)